MCHYKFDANFVLHNIQQIKKINSPLLPSQPGDQLTLSIAARSRSSSGFTSRNEVYVEVEEPHDNPYSPPPPPPVAVATTEDPEEEEEEPSSSSEEEDSESDEVKRYTICKKLPAEHGPFNFKS